MRYFPVFLDLEGRDAVREVVASLRADGVAVVMTTHDLDEAERCSDHVVIIDRGTVVAAGSPAELVRPSDSDHILFGAPDELPVDDLAARLGADEPQIVFEGTPEELRANSYIRKEWLEV